MFVNKYKINNRQLSGGTDFSINIPMGQNGGFLGQQELIDTKFVQTEVDKAVNIIFDYEKVKVLPKNVNTITTNITYKVNMLNVGGGYNTLLKWSDIDFDYNDFKFKKNSFTKSFLRLDFYDSDIATNQNFISFITLFPKVKLDVSTGRIEQPTTQDVSFELGNPLVDRRQNGEGFALYHFKDEIIPTVPKYLYMRATFNNAKNGESTGLMSSSNPNLSIDDLMKTTIGTTTKNNLYTRYKLTRDTDGFFYEIDDTYSNNVNVPTSNDSYIVDLYQISAI